MWRTEDKNVDGGGDKARFLDSKSLYPTGGFSKQESKGGFVGAGDIIYKNQILKGLYVS